MMIKRVFLRMVCAMIAILMLAFAGKSVGGSYDVREPEACRLNFTVLSDVHMEGNNFARYRVFAHALQNVTKNESGNDAVVFLGDNTMNGQNIENILFHGTVGRLLKNETVLTVIGNHDIGNGEGDYEALMNRWYDYTAAAFGRELTTPYYYEVIEGYYFILIAMESQEVYEMYLSDAQYDWLAGVLAQAAQSGKPAFVFCHYPADDAVDMNGDYDSRLCDMLSAYNETNDLFYFCGHTHMPLYLFWSFHTSNGFAETYLPRLTELGGEDDRDVIANTGVGVTVEVYENEILIRGRDFYRGEWRTEEDDDGGEVPCEVVYQLKNPLTE